MNSREIESILAKGPIEFIRWLANQYSEIRTDVSEQCYSYLNEEPDLFPDFEHRFVSTNFNGYIIEYDTLTTSIRVYDKDALTEYTNVKNVVYSDNDGHKDLNLSRAMLSVLKDYTKCPRCNARTYGTDCQICTTDYYVDGSHGQIQFDPKTGEVIDIAYYGYSASEGSYISDIAEFDIEEYVAYHGQLATTIDILDIGYWTKYGHYEAPSEDHRLNTKLTKAGLL